MAQVLPELYGGEAELIPIEQAVQARLLQEGMQRERIARNAEAAVSGEEAAEGRWTRAGRLAPIGCVFQAVRLAPFLLGVLSGVL